MRADVCETPAMREQAEAPVATRDPHITPEHRVPALDGIRGIAVLLVLGHHFVLTLPTHFKTGQEPWWLPIAIFFGAWGWAGVDLFFVLSGYLISGILLDSKGTDGYFRNFYARRVLRIFPAYYLLLLILLLMLPALPGDFLTSLNWGKPRGQWHYWTYLSNFPTFLHTRGYKPLGHTWSLAIEEQFYLVWPAIIFFLRRPWVNQLCIAILVGMVLLRIGMFAEGYNQGELHHVTFTRVDSLGMGAWLATLYRSPIARPRLRTASWIALLFGFAALLLGSYVGSIMPNRGSIFQVATGYTLIALTGAGLIGAAATSPATDWLNRALGMGWLCWFGRFSYGLYLYHYPILLVIQKHMGSIQTGYGLFARFVLFPAATIAATLISWYLLERPMLSLKRFFPTRTARLVTPCPS